MPILPRRRNPGRHAGGQAPALFVNLDPNGRFHSTKMGGFMAIMAQDDSQFTVFFHSWWAIHNLHNPFFAQWIKSMQIATKPGRGTTMT